MEQKLQQVRIKKLMHILAKAKAATLSMTLQVYLEKLIENDNK